MSGRQPKVKGTVSWQLALDISCVSYRRRSGEHLSIQELVKQRLLRRASAEAWERLCEKMTAVIGPHGRAHTRARDRDGLLGEVTL